MPDTHIITTRRNIATHLRSKFKKRGLGHVTWMTAQAYGLAETTAVINNLKKENEFAHKSLAAINPKLWAHTHSINQWYKMIMSIAEESVDTVLKGTK